MGDVPLARTHTPLFPPPPPTPHTISINMQVKDLAQGTDCTAWGPPSSDVLEQPYTEGGGGGPPPLDPPRPPPPHPPPLPMLEANSQNSIAFGKAPRRGEKDDHS